MRGDQFECSPEGLEKPGIELTTHSLQGEQLNHHTTMASRFRHDVAHTMWLRSCSGGSLKQKEVFLPIIIILLQTKH